MSGSQNKSKKKADAVCNKLRLAVCACEGCKEDKYAFLLLPSENGVSNFCRHGVIVKSRDLTHKSVTEKQKGAVYANQVSPRKNSR
jgi:hypothetical protein